MIDRLAYVGGDPAARELRGYLIAVSNNRLLVHQARPWRPLAAHELQPLTPFIEHSHYVGEYGGEACHVVHLAEPDLDLLQTYQFDWVGLRSQLGVIDDDLFQLGGRALQLVNWYSHHRFCGRCGAQTVLAERDRAAICQDCETPYYPRISPCVIGVIARGEQCLLAKHRDSRSNRYTALAGFIEPGETAEQALAREVEEEVGLQIKNIRYFASQPWPFPGQLMLAFHADYASGTVRVDQDEIDDARWFHARELPQLPPPGTISARLIDSFVRRVIEG